MYNPIVTHEIATHNIEFEITHYVELKEKVVHTHVNCLCISFTSDQIDENLRTALQQDLLLMAPGLRVQVKQYLFLCFFPSFVQLYAYCLNEFLYGKV